MVKNSLGGKGLFCSNFHRTGHPIGKSRQELKAGAQNKPAHECCLLSVQAHTQLSYIAQDHLPGGGAAYSGLGLLTAVRNEEPTP